MQSGLTPALFKPNTIHSEKTIEELFVTSIVQGNKEEAARLIDLDPQVLLKTADVTDLSERHFKAITGYQGALWALDEDMVKMIDIKASQIPGEEGKKIRAALLLQHQELKENKISYLLNGTLYKEVHYDHKPLSEAYQHYGALCFEEIKQRKCREKSNTYNKPVLTNSKEDALAESKTALDIAWSNIGKSQQLMPAHAIQEMCSLKGYFNKNESHSFSRSFQFHDYENMETHLHALFPVKDAKQGALGIDFILKRSAWENRIGIVDRVKAHSNESYVSYIIADGEKLNRLFQQRARELDLTNSLVSHVVHNKG